MSETLLGKPLGSYDCSDLGDLMERQSAQPVYSTQTVHQRGAFPTGVAVPAVVPLVLIVNYHYINTSPRPVLVDARVNLAPIEESEVRHIAGVFMGSTQDLELPPRSRKIEARTCRLTRDFNLSAISSHSHGCAECLTLSFYDGRTGKIAPRPFYANRDWQSPPFLFLEQAEWTQHRVIPLRAGDGIHWACHYANPSDQVIRTGPSASDEMCLFVGVGYPAPLSVEDIKRIVADPTPDDLDELRKVIAPCEPVDVRSPWPRANEPTGWEEPPAPCEG